MGFADPVDLSKRNVVAEWEGNEVFLSQGPGTDDLHLLINKKALVSVTPDGKVFLHNVTTELVGKEAGHEACVARSGKF